MSWYDMGVKEFLNFSRDSSRSSQASPTASRASSRASPTKETRVQSLDESSSSSRRSKRYQTSDVERDHSSESAYKRRRLDSTDDSASHTEVLSSPQFSALLSSLLDEKLGSLKEALSTALAPGTDARDPNTGPAPHVSNGGYEEDSVDAPLLQEVCAEVNRTLDWSKLPDGCQVIDKEGQLALFVWARHEEAPPEWHHLPLVSLQWREDPQVAEGGAFFYRAKSLAQLRSSSSMGPLTPAKFQEAIFSIRRLLDGSVTPEDVFMQPNASGQERSTVVIPMSVTFPYEPYWNKSVSLWERAAASADYVSQTAGANPSTSTPVQVADPHDALAPLLQFLQAPPLSSDPLLPGLKSLSKKKVAKDTRVRKMAETLLSGSFLGLFLASLARQAAASPEELSPQQVGLFLTELATAIEAQALSSRGVARDMLERSVITRMDARREAVASVSASTKTNLLHSSPFSPSLFDKEEARRIMQAAAPRVDIRWPKHLDRLLNISPTQRGCGRGYNPRVPAKAVPRGPPRTTWRPRSTKPREGTSPSFRKGASQTATKKVAPPQQTGQKQVSVSICGVNNQTSSPQLQRSF